MGARRRSQPVGYELRNVSDEWLEEIRYQHSANTHRNYADQVGRVLLTWLGKKGITRLDEITRPVMIDYLNAQRVATYTYKNQPHIIRRISPSTLEHRYDGARLFFKWCVARGYIKASPMETVARPKGEQRAVFAFNREEVKRLLRAAGSAPGILAYRDRAMVVCLLGTGARASELTAMSTSCQRCKGECIDWARGELVLHGKNSRDRRMRIGRELRKALREWLDVRTPIPGGWVWTTHRRTVFSKFSLNTWTDKLGEYADVDNCHPHRFRHTFAVEFYTAHQDIKALQRRLGHSNPAITERYLRSLGVDYGLDDKFTTPDEWLRA